MTKEFLQKVIDEKVVDTKGYRYFAEQHLGGLRITRCSQSAIGTTGSLPENREFVTEVK
jgi:hypothetical protein